VGELGIVPPMVAMVAMVAMVTKSCRSMATELCRQILV